MEYRFLAMKLAAALASQGICPECGFTLGETHNGTCSQSYEKEKFQPYSRDIETPFVNSFENKDGE